jgi:hypothetical protein
MQVSFFHFHCVKLLSKRKLIGIKIDLQGLENAKANLSKTVHKKSFQQPNTNILENTGIRRCSSDRKIR